jgi:hypothetical protein
MTDRFQHDCIPVQVEFSAGSLDFVLRKRKGDSNMRIFDWIIQAGLRADFPAAPF